jgi:hypothetical protein
VAEAVLPDRFDAALADTRWPDGAAALMRTARERGLPGVLDAEAPVREAEAALYLASHIAFSAQGLRDWAGMTISTRRWRTWRGDGLFCLRDRWRKGRVLAAWHGIGIRACLCHHTARYAGRGGRLAWRLRACCWAKGRRHPTPSDSPMRCCRHQVHPNQWPRRIPDTRETESFMKEAPLCS